MVKKIDGEDYVLIKKISDKKHIIKSLGSGFEKLLPKLKGKWDIDPIIVNKSYYQPKKLNIVGSMKGTMTQVDNSMRPEYVRDSDIRTWNIKILKVRNKAGKIKYYAHANDAMGEKVI